VKELEFFTGLYYNSLCELEDRIRIHLEIEKGRLLNAVYQYETFENDKWIAIVRFDCSHGQVFHKDIMYSNGDKEKEVVEVFSVKEFALYARYDLVSKWKFYKERYFNRKRMRL
jgi:hypothetical protein